MNYIQSDPEQVVEGVERIGRLPAVATHDWCDLAANAVADSLLGSKGSGVIAVGIGSAQGESIDRLESVGVCGVGGATKDAEDVKKRLGAMGFFQPGIDARALKGEASVVMAPATELQGSASWRSSPICRLLTSRGLSAFLIGAGLIADTDPTRMLWVLGAVEENGAYLGDMMFAMVILMALLRRARLALSGVGSDMSEWVSPREQEILKELVLGKSVRQIAEETGRSPHTVHDHVKSLHRKLNATSRGELIARALGHVSQATRVREASRKLKHS